MLEQSFGLTFFLKSSSKESKERTIYLRATVDGVPKETSTKRKWDIVRWNQKLERATGTKEDAKALNLFLDSLAAKVNQHRTYLMLEGDTVSAQKLIDFADWYNHYNGVSYQILKEIGELVPEVLTWIIPELKASKLEGAKNCCRD